MNLKRSNYQRWNLDYLDQTYYTLLIKTIYGSPDIRSSYTRYIKLGK